MSGRYLDAETQEQAFSAAARVRHGYLSAQQRDVLANLVLIAAQAKDAPTPVAVAALRVVQECVWEGVGSGEHGRR